MAKVTITKALLQRAIDQLQEQTDYLVSLVCQMSYDDPELCSTIRSNKDKIRRFKHALPRYS